jgi:hypothetical protein
MLKEVCPNLDKSGEKWSNVGESDESWREEV